MKPYQRGKEVQEEKERELIEKERELIEKERGLIEKGDELKYN